MDGDEELWEHMHRNGFDDRRWQILAARLTHYGYQVIGAWVNDRTIFARCTREGARGAGGPGPLDRMSPEDLEELVQDTVASGLAGLRRREVEGKAWRSDGGRSLRSYFISACLFAFPAVYRTHCRNQRRWFPGSNIRTIDLTRSVPDVAESVATRDEARRLLDGIADVDLRSAVYLWSQRYTHAEIAVALGDGTTVKRVERMLSRYRDRRRGNPILQDDVVSKEDGRRDR